MLTIRLSRTGRKNKPMYRLIISEKSQTPKGRALEYLGFYNPYTKELEVKADRIKHWLSVGAGMSDTVNNLLISKQIIKGKKIAVAKCKKKVVAGEEVKRGGTGELKKEVVEESKGEATEEKKAEESKDNKVE